MVFLLVNSISKEIWQYTFLKKIEVIRMEII